MANFHSFEDESSNILKGLSTLADAQRARESLFRAAKDRIESESSGAGNRYIVTQAAPSRSANPSEWIEKAKFYFQPLHRRAREEIPSKDKIKPDPIFGAFGSLQARSHAFLNTSTG